MSELTVDDLPLVENDEQAAYVHRTPGLYFVKKKGKAHASLTCRHMEDTRFPGERIWHMANSNEVRKLGMSWC